MDTFSRSSDLSNTPRSRDVVRRTFQNRLMYRLDLFYGERVQSLCLFAPLAHVTGLPFPYARKFAVLRRLPSRDRFIGNLLLKIMIL